MMDRAPSERVDVCVIGSGPAGSLIANDLARRGHEVVVLEAGERFDFESRLERMERGLRPAYDNLDVWEMGGERDRYANAGSVTYPLNTRRVKGVGGSSLHWGARLGRLHEKDFEMDTRYGLATDWPISYSDLQPYYRVAEQELGVSGPADNPFAPPREAPPPMDPFPPSYSDRLFAEACEELGITMHRVMHARNSEPYDGRSGCVGYGTCSPVCPSGAQYSADHHVRKAEEHGARIIDQAPVQRLVHDAEGERITEAVYATPEGNQYRQAARLFVVAAGGVETPRLLLLSKSEQYPEGLANSSGLVGHYFAERPTCGVTVEVDRRTRQNLIGFGTSESHQFYDYEEPLPGSFKLEFKNIRGQTPLNLALSQRNLLRDIRGAISDPLNMGEWSELAETMFTGDKLGDELLEEMRAGFGNTLGMSAAIEGLPKRENRVTLDASKTDDHGNPIPKITWTPSDFARETMEAAFEVMEDIFDHVPAEVRSVSRYRNWKGIGHHLGTTRMGADPSKSVVDPTCRTHDIENLYIASSSVFVTGGAIQPTLTIAALALRVAERLHSEL